MMDDPMPSQAKPIALRTSRRRYRPTTLGQLVIGVTVLAVLEDVSSLKRALPFQVPRHRPPQWLGRDLHTNKPKVVSRRKLTHVVEMVNYIVEHITCKGGDGKGRSVTANAATTPTWRLDAV